MEPRREAIERLAWWLDESLAVPGTRFRLGFDAIIGLIPGIGDLVGTLLGSYIIAVAASRGLPPSALARMAINLGVEALVGMIPIAGDVFDAAWKANRRNIELLRQFERGPRAARAQSRAVVTAWILGLLAVLAALGFAALTLVRLLAEAVARAG